MLLRELNCTDFLGLQHLAVTSTGSMTTLAAAGIPNISNPDIPVGVQGGLIHSSDEYLKVNSLTERAKLSALMLMKLASSDNLHWLEEH